MRQLLILAISIEKIKIHVEGEYINAARYLSNLVWLRKMNKNTLGKNHTQFLIRKKQKPKQNQDFLLQK